MFVFVQLALFGLLVPFCMSASQNALQIEDMKIGFSSWENGKGLFTFDTPKEIERRNEDRARYLKLPNNEGTFIAVFDGTGGDSAVKHFYESVEQFFLEEREKGQSDKNILSNTIKRLHNSKPSVFSELYDFSGSTVSLVYINNVVVPPVATFAGVGDTRALMIKENAENTEASEIIVETKDDTYHNAVERRRVGENNFKCYDGIWRVESAGSECTRVLGLRGIRDRLILYEPAESISVQLTNPGWYTILVATDGVWNTIDTTDSKTHEKTPNNIKAVKRLMGLIEKNKEKLEVEYPNNPIIAGKGQLCGQVDELTEGGNDLWTRLMARAICAMSKEDGSTDNITSLIVRFNVCFGDKNSVEKTSRFMQSLERYGKYAFCVIGISLFLYIIFCDKKDCSLK